MRTSSDELAALAGLDPSTLSAALTTRANSQHSPPPAVARMGPKRRDYIPLTATELALLEEVFSISEQARVPGSTILNSLLQHVICGTPWERLPEHAAARMRLRRSARRGEFAKIVGFVEQHANDFCDEHREGFHRLARMEVALRARNEWNQSSANPDMSKSP